MKRLLGGILIMFNILMINTSPRDIEKLESKLLFYTNLKWNMQGLEYYDGNFIIGYDRGKGNGCIEIRNNEGKIIKQSGLLKIGHTSELVFNKNNSKLYISNGGGKNSTKLYEVDLKGTIKIEREFNFEELGNSGLIAIDQQRNNFIIHTAKGDREKHKFTVCDIKGQKVKCFELSNIGIPQGIEYLNNKIYFYTNNKITVIDLHKEKVLKEYRIEANGESEGLAINEENDCIKLYYGYNKCNRLYESKIEKD